MKTALSCKCSIHDEDVKAKYTVLQTLKYDFLSNILKQPFFVCAFSFIDFFQLKVVFSV